MLCSECKKNQATYHSIKKVNGHTTEKHLCHECHTKLMGKETKFADIEDIFSGFKNMFEIPSKRTQGLRCPQCGTTSSEFLDTGFVGCEYCYESLASVLAPVIQKIQGDARHTGKAPLGQISSDGAEYERLRRDLEEAIRLENFEEAMILRDRMRALRG